MSTVEQVRNLTESAREFLWEIVIPTIPGAVSSFVQEMTLRARNAMFPGMSIGNTPTFFKGVMIKRPSRRDYPRVITVTLEEGMNLAVYNTLHTWMQQFRDSKTGIGGGEGVLKVDGVLLRLLDYSDTVLGSAELFGFYPETVPDVTLDMAGEGFLMIPATFSYDWWRLI